MGSAAAQAEGALEMLISGGGGLNRAIPETRQDLADIAESLKSAIARLRGQVQSVTSSTTLATMAADRTDLRLVLEDVEAKLDGAITQFTEEYPVIAESFAWTLIIYVAIVVPWLLCTLLAGFWSGGLCDRWRRKSGRTES